MLERNGGVRPNTDRLTTGFVPSAAVLQADPVATVEMIWAASVGDLRAIRRLVARGIPLDVADYDLRTPLHLAAAEGHLEVMKYLLALGVSPNPKDRWGNTPLDDSLRHGQDKAVPILQLEGGRRSIEEQEEQIGLDVPLDAEGVHNC